MREFTITAPEEGQRLDRYLEKLLPGAGKSFLYKMLRKKNITLNEHRAEGPEKLSRGDVVKVWFSEETFLSFAGPEKRTADKHSDGKYSDKKASGKNTSRDCVPKPAVLFENEHILILNKPAGLLSQKAEKEDYSVNQWVLEYLTDSGVYSKESYGTFVPAAVNRLDRNTSGILLAGKTRTGSAFLSEQLRLHTGRKIYETFVCGEISEAKVYVSRLEKDSKSNTSRIKETVACPVKENASESGSVSESDTKREKDTIITEVYPVSYNRELDVTYCKICLITGKSHQIRAQLSALGHPLLGDKKYGYATNHPSADILREVTAHETYPGKKNETMHILHASRLELPAGCGLKEQLIIEAPLPAYAQVLRNKFH